MTQTKRARWNLLGGLEVFFDRRILVMLALGFSAGLPNLLIFDTLSAWLREAGLSLEVIGFFGLATLSYSFKFLWAPLVDRTTIPLLTKRLGHRRSWMLMAQIAITLGLWLIAGSNPVGNLGLVAIFAVLTGFSSATQDIVIDAWRIEAAEQARQGAMAAAYQWGYRIAIVVAGAVPLVIAEHLNWSMSYSVMAALMGVGMLAVLFAPRERAHAVRHVPTEGIVRRPAFEAFEWAIRLGIIVAAALVLGAGLTGKGEILSPAAKLILGHDGGETFVSAFKAKPNGIWIQLGFVLIGFGLVALAAWPIPRVRTFPGAYLSYSLGAPLADFFRRFRGTAAMILALICVYRLAEFVLNIMNPFYLDLGFTLTQIAEVRKLFGVLASMLGVFAGGWAIARLGLMRSLVIGAFAQPVSHVGFIWLATQGADLSALFVAIGLDNVASAFAGTCLIAYMSSLTSEGFTATQYALFSSLYSLPGKLIASQSGRIVEASARSIEAGGFFSFLRGLLSGLPPSAYAEGAAKMGVAPVSLAGGYMVFLIYSGLIGLGGIVLAMIIAARQPADATTEPEATPAGAPAKS